MRRVSLRMFRANMAKELDAVPFILTRKGVDDYVVCTHEENKPCTQDKKRVHTPGPIEQAETIIRKAIAKKSKTSWVGGYSKDQQTGKKAKR